MYVSRSVTPCKHFHTLPSKVRKTDHVTDYTGSRTLIPFGTTPSENRCCWAVYLCRSVGSWEWLSQIGSWELRHRPSGDPWGFRSRPRPWRVSGCSGVESITTGKHAPEKVQKLLVAGCWGPCSRGRRTLENRTIPNWNSHRTSVDCLERLLGVACWQVLSWCTI